MQRFSWHLTRRGVPDDPDAAVGLRSLYGGMTGAYSSAYTPDGGQGWPDEDLRSCGRRDRHKHHEWEWGPFVVLCPGRRRGEQEPGG